MCFDIEIGTWVYINKLSFFVFVSLKISRSVARINAWPPANACLHSATFLYLSVYQRKMETNNHSCAAESLICSPGSHPWTPQSKMNLRFSFCFCYEWIIYSRGWWNAFSCAFFFPALIPLQLLPSTCPAACLTGIQCSYFALPYDSLPLTFGFTASQFYSCIHPFSYPCCIMWF